MGNYEFPSALPNPEHHIDSEVQEPNMNLQSPMKILLTAAVALTMASSAVFAQGNDHEALRDRIDMLLTTHEATVDGARIAAVELIDALYARREYAPAWTDPAMVKQLFDQVLRSVEHGLDPEDFHAKQLGIRLNPGPRANDPVFRADIEILCTDALARLAITLQFGKLDPAELDPAWNFSRHIVREDPLTYFNKVLDTKTVSLALDTLGPQNPQYRWFRDGLKKYRSIKAAGGWPTVSTGAVLQLGSKGPRVAELRQRLRVTRDLSTPDPAEPEEFDSGLEAAVKNFQLRHGVDADGKAGPRTVEELNIPVEVRINQLRASLERMRWVFRDLPNKYVIVDIAGFHVYLMDEGEEIWEARVQVGKPYHATPVFKDTMRYLDFNPTWTIPPGILNRSTLPAIRKDPGYLSRSNMTVITTSGKVVDPSAIDWAATATKGFPYMIRQEPGPDNALGLVKFMFPNKYMVYLHDTPSKGLFGRPERTFSSGCIRVQDPFKLAELLLDDQGWNRTRIDQVVASRKTTRVNLENPIPVMLLYWTAEVDEEGTVFFRKDVYNRDAPIIKGLDEPFRVSLPQGTQKAIQRPYR
jgi:murein L,D-transpeptidase YcbB/YkuD